MFGAARRALTVRRRFASGPTGWEGWEPPVYATYLASTVLLVVGLSSKPDTRITEWAKEEVRKKKKY